MTSSKIVVADGYATNPGDLDWAPLCLLGQVVIHDRSGAALVARCAGASIVLTNKEVFSREVLTALPALRFISVLATGTNVVDLAAAKELGVVVSNVPAYSTRSVVQHTLALILELNAKTAAHSEAAHDGRWRASKDFSFRLGPITELAGKTLGLVGFGAIGQGVAKALLALGMHVVAARQSSTDSLCARFPEVSWAEVDDVFASADVLSLHCPLTAATTELVSERRLGLMKSSALLINTARGPLIDESALATALNSGRLRGAALDVLVSEPPATNDAIMDARNCLITPHLGWATVEARTRLLQASVENVRAFLEGHPRNQVA